MSRTLGGNNRQEPCLIHEVKSSSSSFCKCILSVVMPSKRRKYEDENRGFGIKWEDEFVFVQRNQIKYSVLKIDHY
jgi:hypothetical protein